MRLSKDKKSIQVNDTLTLGGIPPGVLGCRVGNRSAIEWAIDQYRVKEDPRSGIRIVRKYASFAGSSNRSLTVAARIGGADATNNA